MHAVRDSLRVGVGGRYINRITNDAREDEMNENLGVVHDILGDLRNQAAAMGEEIDEQNVMIDQINDKTQSNIKRVDVCCIPIVPDLTEWRCWSTHASFLSHLRLPIQGRKS